MPEPPNYTTVLDSDSRRTPVRVAFVTRRTSPHVNATDDPFVMTHPETLLRVAIATELLLIALSVISLVFNAPLEGLADPLQTPNPAKAPWYFLGLQELLHYFPPIVGGVLIPTLVVIALVVIPYFNINIEAGGLWTKNRSRRMRVLTISVIVLTIGLSILEVWAILAPTLFVAALMYWTAGTPPDSGGRLRRWLTSKPLPFWIMTWFLIEAIVLTVIGTLFRGPGWSLVVPWGGQI
jgi:menaquinol-cytochrome c reductase cytochrome b/c subunit